MIVRKKFADAIESGGALLFVGLLLTGCLIVVFASVALIEWAGHVTGIEPRHDRAKAIATAAYDRATRQGDLSLCADRFHAASGRNECARFLEAGDSAP